MSKLYYFAICPSCKKTWNTRDDFLADSDMVLNGYQASIKDIESGMLLFTNYNNCLTTMSIKVNVFIDLYKGKRYSDNRALTPGCPRYCIDEKRLDRCDVLCECAFVREIVSKIVAIKNHPLPKSII